MSITDERKSRQTSILAQCEEPRTLKELCEHFEVSHMTIRRELELLMEMGMLQVCAFRRGKEKLYKTTYLNDEKLGGYNLRRFGRSILATETLDDQPVEAAIHAMSKIPRFIVSKMLAEFALESGWAVPFESGYPSVAQCRLLLAKAIEQMKEVVHFLEQLDELPGWDSKYIFTLYGQRDIKFDAELWEQIRQNLSEFEQTIDERNWTQILGIGVQVPKST